MLNKIIPVLGFTSNGTPIVYTPFLQANNLIGFKLYRGLGLFYFKQMFLSKKYRNGNLTRFIWILHLITNIKLVLLLPVIYYYRKKTGRGLVARFIDYSI